MLPDIHSHPHLPLWQHFLLRAGSFNVLVVSLIPFFSGYYYFVNQYRPSCCGSEPPAYVLELLLLLTVWGICVFTEHFWLKKHVRKKNPSRVVQPQIAWYQIVLPNLSSLFFLLFCLALPSAKITYLVLSTGSLALQMHGWLLPQPTRPFFSDTQQDERIRKLLLNLSVIPWLGLACLFSLFLMPKGTGDCSSGISSVKANMHTLQSMVETYAEKHAAYPVNLQVLEQDARSNKQPYWKDFVSPLSCSLEYGKNRTNFEQVVNTHTGLILQRKTPVDILGLRLYVDQRGRGTVLYKRLSPQHYQIYGTDRVGKLIKDKGSDFFLSNVSD